MLNPTSAQNEEEMNQIYEMMGDKNKIQEICPNYMLGFCVYGPKCRLVHLKSVIIDEQTNLEALSNINLEKFMKNTQDSKEGIFKNKTSNNENDETQTQSNIDSRSTNSNKKTD